MVFLSVLFVPLGDAYSMKTYQSITSLATSAAVSSYSLCSNGFTISTTTPNNNINNRTTIVAPTTPCTSRTQPSTPNRSSIVTLYDNDIDIQHQQDDDYNTQQAHNYENQIQIQISCNSNNDLEHFVKKNSVRKQYQNIIHINPEQLYTNDNNNLNNHDTMSPTFLRNHINYQTPTHHIDKYNNTLDEHSTANSNTASISNCIIQLSGNYENVKNQENFKNVDIDIHDDDDECSVQNTRL